MKKAVASGALATFLFAGAAYAQPVVYTWTGVGINVVGTSKCPTYKMTIEVTVDGKEVKGKFLQEGRVERFFQTTLGKNGAIKTAAALGSGNMIDVVGVINEAESKIKLDGYCKFEGPLTRKAPGA